eukprot:GHVS01033436.1.p1 GENE.GHVS01033436.1~~GHVS01033436.1.p1  ORF type:complete len:276 (+),score=45.74 GHVS01033436.1:152-979(+)
MKPSDTSEIHRASGYTGNTTGREDSSAVVTKGIGRKSFLPKSVFGSVTSIFSVSKGGIQFNRPDAKSVPSCSSSPQHFNDNQCARHSPVNASPPSSTPNTSFLHGFSEFHLSDSSESELDIPLPPSRCTRPSTSPASSNPSRVPPPPSSHVPLSSPRPSNRPSSPRPSSSRMPPPSPRRSYGTGLGGLGCYAEPKPEHTAMARREAAARDLRVGEGGHRNSADRVSFATESAREARGRLAANVDNLKRLENKTAHMADEAATFADLSRQLRQKYS